MKIYHPETLERRCLKQGSDIPTGWILGQPKKPIPEKICPKCGTSYHNKYGSHCSRKCANARTHSEETKTKMRLTSKINNIKEGRWHKGKPAECEICKNVFQKSRCSSRFCSKECRKLSFRSKIVGSKRTPEQRKRISTSRKKRFSDGSLKVTGGDTQWKVYKNIKVQGSYELRTCMILDKLMELGEISSWNYAVTRVEYVNIEGNPATYTIDFTVITPSKTYYIETKGYIKPNDILKWEECKRRGMELLVWFKKDIQEQEKRLQMT